MELNLKRPIIFFDLETTGIDIARDRIVEISMVKVMPTARRSSVRGGSIRECRFRPKLRPFTALRTKT